MGSGNIEPVGSTGKAGVGKKHGGDQQGSANFRIFCIAI